MRPPISFRMLTGLVIALSVTLWAAPSEGAATDVLTAELPEVRVAAGGRTTFTVTLRIKSGYHTMSNLPGQEWLVPTSLSADADGFTLTAVYPAGDDYELASGEPPIKVYSGEVAIVARLTAPPSAAVGRTEIPLTLRYQACAEGQCLAPQSVPLRLIAEILPAGTPTPETAGTEPTLSDEPPDFGSEEQRARADLAEAYEKGLPWILVTVLLGGLALNVTPCVFPLLPVTMGFFASQGEHRPTRTFPMAAVYVLSMAAVFTALGMAAALLGSQIGWFLTSVYGRATIGVVLAVLAASLFGAFEIRLPTGFLSRFQGRTGWIGAALMGAAVGLVAAPCVGPFLSTLVLFVAGIGNVALGALLFFVLALGLGMPYLFLGVFTGLVNKVPRGGPYLVWFRSLLAFPLLVLIVHFLSADLPAWLVWTLYAAIGLGGAVYLGIIEGWGRGAWSRRFVAARVAAAMIFTAAAVGAFTLRAMPALGLGGAATGQAIPWQDFGDGRLQEARDDGAPAVVYFTARWCTYCRTMDATVFRDAEVARAAEGVRLLKVDLTDGTPSGDALRVQGEHTSGNPPALLFYDRRGRLAARRGKVGTREFLDLLRRIKR